MYKEDILGSLAHVKMLGEQNIIPKKDSNKIIAGLETILSRMENGVIKIDEASEDIHNCNCSLGNYHPFLPGNYEKNIRHLYMVYDGTGIKNFFV